MAMTIAHLYRFPIKGLSPEILDAVELVQGYGFPKDRSYAVTDGSFIFDPSQPVPQPKTKFLMLAKYERLARLQTTFRADPDRLSVSSEFGPDQEYDLISKEGRETLAHFLSSVVSVELPGEPRVVNAPGHQFTDVSVHSVALMRSISLINLASVRDLSIQVGAELDPVRFRGNITFDGLDAWQELEMVGQHLHIGDVVLKVVRRTLRCAATSVNPATAERDINIPIAIRKYRNHGDLGVYAEVVRGGVIAPGMAITIAPGA